MVNGALSKAVAAGQAEARLHHDDQHSAADARPFASPSCVSGDSWIAPEDGHEMLLHTQVRVSDGLLLGHYE